VAVRSAEERGEVARRILVNTFYRSLADVGSKVASIALFVVMARELGDAGFGVFMFGLSLVTIVTTLGGFGQDVVLTREVVRDRSRLAGYWANTLALKLGLVFPVLALAVVVLWALGTDAETLAVVILLGLAVVAELLMSTGFATFQAYERLGFVPVVLISQRFFTAIVGIVALLLGAGVVEIAAVYLLGAVLALVLAFGLQFARVAQPPFEVDVKRWQGLMLAAAPVGLFTAFAVTLFRVDTTMLAAFESKDVVGEYGVAYRLLEATLFLSWGVGAAIYPVLARLTRTSEPPLALVFSSSLKLLIALTLPLAAGAAVLADPLVRLIYGPDYEQAGVALALLAPTIALYPISYASGSLLIAQDRAGVLTKVYGVITTENILANLVLIPWLSLYGAALSTSISQILLTAWLIVPARRTAGDLSWLRVLTGPVLASGVAALVMTALYDRLILAIAVGAASYLALLVAFELRVYPDDGRALRRMLLRSERARRDVDQNA
jgi:O-antigen/teichoic acid export membrane protein